ncbi:hypothetical protein BDW22DRAFT_1029009 [Trametopsis cervina]|nr:hypothetical protein BDW22DRAFT_1029009 [Trametopsis cervina]
MNLEHDIGEDTVMTADESLPTTTASTPIPIESVVPLTPRSHVPQGANLDIDFVPRRGGGHANLKDQPDRLRTICTDAFEDVFQHFCTTSAYEGSHTNHHNWVRNRLIVTAAIRDDDEIRGRLTNDDVYARNVSSLILNRVQGWRSKVFTGAISKINSAYKLDGFTDVAERKATIDKLLTWDKSYTYTFPFDSPETRRPVKSKPYILSIFTDILSPLFKMASAAQVHMEFKCSDDNELELPIAILALSATMVYAALDYDRRGWLNGTKRRPAFNSDVYHEVYTYNVQQLESMRTKPLTKTACHALLQRLLQQLVIKQEDENKAPQPAPEIEVDIIEIDLD